MSVKSMNPEIEICYSGLQAFCETLGKISTGYGRFAGLSGMSSSVDYEEYNPYHDYKLSAKLLATAIFNNTDRFESKSRLSNIWKAADKPKAFEECWLGAGGVGKSATALRNASVMLRDPHATVARLAGIAVEGLDADQDDLACRFMYLKDSLEGIYNLKETLEDEILPAMRLGFRAERYREFEIDAFANGIEALLRDMDANKMVEIPSPVRGGKPSLGSVFDVLIERMVSAVIYGPSSKAALPPNYQVTDANVIDSSESDVLPADAKSIALIQMFDGAPGLHGVMGTFSDADVVFIGRNGKADDYKAKVKKLKFSHLTEDRRTKVLQLSDANGGASGIHAMVLCDGGRWYVYDLDSSNGTFIRGDDAYVQASPVERLEPGDEIVCGYLGAEFGPYSESALLRFAYCLDAETVIREQDKRHVSALIDAAK
ncbi:FHA domain-containing protein [Slackia heliotrinireducens]|uniref:FHA domain-containing protein n=1 Tax=Slackia heliotrinireducens TaxID=84110 RepID=UPI003315EA64